MTELQATSRPRRPRPKAVTLTDAAAERVREILDNAENAHIGLRIGVKNGGCAGQEYTFAYADEIGPLDEVVLGNGSARLDVGVVMGFASIRCGEPEDQR